MVDGPRAADGAAFAQALSALKRRGSNLLVVGGTMEGAHTDACDRLLGEDEDPPRRRVFVHTDGTTGCDPATHAAAGDRTRVVTQRTETRSVAAGRPSADGAATRQVPESDLGELTDAIADAVVDLEPADGYDPAQLRVCFDSLLPLLAGHDEEAVFRALSMVTARVRQADGMAHYHLPVGVDQETVSLVEPLFDAVIDLRVRGGTPEHNWELVERDVTSGWLPL